MYQNRIKQSGFTLVELLVAITIVAMLSSIAVPLYTRYSERSYLTEVQADLLNCAQALERQSALTFSYFPAADLNDDGIAEAADGAISADICRPLSTDNLRYNIEVASAATTYTLTAIAPNGSPMQAFGDLTLNNAGIRTWDQSGDGNIDADENDWIFDD